MGRRSRYEGKHIRHVSCVCVRSNSFPYHGWLESSADDVCHDGKRKMSDWTSFHVRRSNMIFHLYLYSIESDTKYIENEWGNENKETSVVSSSATIGQSSISTRAKPTRLAADGRIGPERMTLTPWVRERPRKWDVSVRNTLSVRDTSLARTVVSFAARVELAKKIRYRNLQEEYKIKHFIVESSRALRTKTSGSPKSLGASIRIDIGEVRLSFDSELPRRSSTGTRASCSTLHRSLSSRRTFLEM